MADWKKIKAEYVRTDISQVQLAKKYGVEIPIIEQVNLILFEDKPAREAMADLMSRDKKNENLGLSWDE